MPSLKPQAAEPPAPSLEELEAHYKNLSDDAMREDLARLAREGPPPRLGELLEPAELAATMDRVDWLLSLRALPELVDDGEWPPYPWPLV